ncbi:MAG: acetate kinase [Eubacteriales bacterium]|nr:acetate kinase [Eubacteriales bacterium]
MKILVLNVGSSTIKYQLFNMVGETVLSKGLLERIGTDTSALKHEKTGKDAITLNQQISDHSQGINLILKMLVDSDYGPIQDLSEIDAVGHRVVHGGEHFSKSIIIDEKVRQAIKECCGLAPLHNPPNLIGIEECQSQIGDIKHVAVFDTAFHQTMKPVNYLYALPMEMYTKYKIRRYGFHGTSHDFVSHKAAEFLRKPYNQCKIISIHLGNGASMAAIRDGQVVDTSMGLTPLEGLVMGTRCGDIDPAIIYLLMDKLNMNPNQANDYFNQKSGMLGLTGFSSDLRDILDASASGNQTAKLAIDIYCMRVKGYIGKYMAELNGCDCIIFTAGVGENAVEIRSNICENMDYMGIKIDPEKNRISGKQADISSHDSRVKVLVIPTNEELIIARETNRLIK